MEIPKPNPAAFARAKEAFEKVDVETKSASTAMEALTKAIPQNRQQGPGPRKPHLTHRPFVNPAIVTLRKGLQDSTRIKKK